MQHCLTLPPQVAHFAIHGGERPSVTQSLQFAESMHRALCSNLEPGLNNRALTGRDEAGAPLCGHGHSYFLPGCDELGLITHVTLNASQGFDEAACRALQKIHRIWEPGWGFDVRVDLISLGQPSDFEKSSLYFHQSKIWVSLTPFVPVRHAKATRSGVMKMDKIKRLQVGSAEHDCWRLLEAIAPDLQIVGVSRTGNYIRVGSHSIPCIEFRQDRTIGGGIRACCQGQALRIQFSHEVSMPFGVGYGAHFGLGIFLPVETQP